MSSTRTEDKTTSLKKEVLWDTPTTTTGTITLEKSIDEFDAIYAYGGFYNASLKRVEQKAGQLIFKEDYYNTDTNWNLILNFSVEGITRRVVFNFTDNKTIYIADCTNAALFKIYGINF